MAFGDHWIDSRPAAVADARKAAKWAFGAWMALSALMLALVLLFVFLDWSPSSGDDPILTFLALFLAFQGVAFGVREQYHRMRLEERVARLEKGSA